MLAMAVLAAVMFGGASRRVRADWVYAWGYNFNGQIGDGVSQPVAFTHGYVLAYHVGAVLLIIGGALVLILLEHVPAPTRTPAAELLAEPV